MTKAWFDFDIRNDPVFKQIVKPFIENQMVEMAAYDRKRQAVKPDIKYIFHEHAERVAQDVKHVAARLGQPEHVQEAMYWAMLAHDLGKKTLPVEVWDSEEKPTGAIKAFRRSHTERGIAIVDDVLGTIDHPFIALMKDVMANHHKTMFSEEPAPGGTVRWVPQEISLPVRLCCIVEGYDGYTIPRPHFGDRDISPRAVLDKMRTDPDKGAKMFDMDLFEAFAQMKLDSQPPAPARGTAPKMKG